MHEMCEKEGGGQPRTVTQLMGSRKVILAILGYIAATRAGQSAQRQKQKEER